MHFYPSLCPKRLVVFAASFTFVGPNVLFPLQVMYVQFVPSYTKVSLSPLFQIYAVFEPRI